MTPVLGSANINATYGYEDCNETFWNYKADTLSLSIQTTRLPDAVALTDLVQPSTTGLQNNETFVRILGCGEKVCVCVCVGGVILTYIQWTAGFGVCWVGVFTVSP